MIERLKTLVKFCALACVSSANMVLAETQTSYSFELTGSVEGSCTPLFGSTEPREGLGIKYKVELELSLLLQEPVITSHLAWGLQPWGSACVRPYGQSDFVEVRDIAEIDPEGKARPYNIELAARIDSPAISGGTVYMRFNTGSLSEEPGEPSYNTPGARNWDRLFFRMSNQSAEFQDETLYRHLTEDEAKEIYAQGFSVGKLHVVRVDFDLVVLKKHFSEQARKAETITSTAQRLAAWGQANIPDYPDVLPKRIAENAQLPGPEAVREQIALIKQMQEYHSSATAAGTDQEKAATEQVNAGVSIFLDGLDAPESSQLLDVLNEDLAEQATAELDLIALAEQKMLDRLNARKVSLVPESPYEFIHFLSADQQAPITIPNFMCGDWKSTELAGTQEIPRYQSYIREKINENSTGYSRLFYINDLFVCALIRYKFFGGPGDKDWSFQLEVFDQNGAKKAERKLLLPDGHHEFGTLLSGDPTDNRLFLLVHHVKGSHEYDDKGARAHSFTSAIIPIEPALDFTFPLPVKVDQPDFVRNVWVDGIPHLLIGSKTQETITLTDYDLNTSSLIIRKGSGLEFDPVRPWISFLGKQNYVVEVLGSSIRSHEIEYIKDGQSRIIKQRSNDETRVNSIRLGRDGSILGYNWDEEEPKMFYRKDDFWTPIDRFDGWIDGYLFRKEENVLVLFDSYGNEIDRVPGKVRYWYWDRILMSQ